MITQDSPTGDLLFYSQITKTTEQFGYLLKVNKRDIRTTSLTSFWCLYC